MIDLLHPRNLVGAAVFAGGGALATWLTLRRRHRNLDGTIGTVPLQLGALSTELGIELLSDAAASLRLVRNAAPARKATSVADVDLADFAATVLNIARHTEAELNVFDLARRRFGGKVFIAEILRRLRETDYATLSRRDVDRLLLDANREGLLQLARADLPAAMDAREVAGSEIADLGSTFHFVVAEEVRNAAAVIGSGTAPNPFRGSYTTTPGEGGVPKTVTWELWQVSPGDWRVHLDVDGASWQTWDFEKPTNIAHLVRFSLPRADAMAIQRQLVSLTKKQTRNAARGGDGTAERPFWGKYKTHPPDGGIPEMVTWSLWLSTRGWRVALKVGGETWAASVKPEEVVAELYPGLSLDDAHAVYREVEHQLALVSAHR